MNHIKKITALLSLFLIIGFACTPKDNSTTAPLKEETTSKPKTNTKPQPVGEANPYLIGEKSFMGLASGNSIADHKDILEKSVLKTGEGEFEVFNIKDKSGKVMGNISPSPKDASKIGIITITSPKAITKEKVKIGMTLKELETILGELPVHGSEIESRTSAADGYLRYVLDAAFGTYEIDKSELKEDTKIRAIEIWSNAYTK